MSTLKAPERPAEFDTPPAEPVRLFGDWLAGARQHGIADPGALALATADAQGRVSSRIVQIVSVTVGGPVFVTHSGSHKARDLAATGWASGVLYWRETSRQVILTGPATQIPEAEAEALWARRPVATQAMSAASEQSALLADEDALREAATQLAAPGLPLPRPSGFVGYQLTPVTLEFWQGSPDRLHRRLRYDREDGCWAARRLQP